MTWITTVPYDEATGRLKVLYDRIKGPEDNVDNIWLAHSSRPHTIEGHMSLYKHVLHNTANKTPKWLLEALGVYVSMLNGCRYCVEHHYQGMRRLLGDDERAETIRKALEDDDPVRASDEDSVVCMLRYARLLTVDPKSVAEQTIDDLRRAGVSDGEILEVNQVVGYFAYANRTILGLGTGTQGDILGLSPSGSDREDWSHQ
jgi:uncharacterized peroxidase-related enzyme